MRWILSEMFLKDSNGFRFLPLRISPHDLLADPGDQFQGVHPGCQGVGGVEPVDVLLLLVLHDLLHDVRQLNLCSRGQVLVRYAPLDETYLVPLGLADEDPLVDLDGDLWLRRCLQEGEPVLAHDLHYGFLQIARPVVLRVPLFEIV